MARMTAGTLTARHTTATCSGVQARGMTCAIGTGYKATSGPNSHSSAKNPNRRGGCIGRRGSSNHPLPAGKGGEGQWTRLEVHGVAHEAQLVRRAGYDLVRRNLQVAQQAIDGRTRGIT